MKKIVQLSDMHYTCLNWMKRKEQERRKEKERKQKLLKVKIGTNTCIVRYVKNGKNTLQLIVLPKIERERLRRKQETKNLIVIIVNSGVMSLNHIVGLVKSITILLLIVN